MGLFSYFAAKAAERDRFYCPCCRDRFEADDMDLAREWKHSDAMRACYGSVCCRACTDGHYATTDGVLVSEDTPVFCGSDGVYSTAEALDDAREEGRAQTAHEIACRGWM